MVRHIDIFNYKSALALRFDLGKINVFIGENGSGKTTILEAISFGSAASQDKLDNEFLASRGLRVLEPKLMKSAFDKEMEKKNIVIGFKNEKNQGLGYEISNSGTFPFDWSIEKRLGNVDEIKKIREFTDIERDTLIQKIFEQSHKFGVKIVEDNDDVKRPQKNAKKSTQKIKLPDEFKKFVEKLIAEEADEKLKNNYISKFGVEKFLIFSPENYFLRRFEEEGQIKPLGIRGEGLFSHLLELSKENPEVIKKISEYLKAIDWFEEFNIPSDLVFSEKKIRIKDKYIKENIEYIDQRSSNEGFLYLLFYITLFLSKYTPDFFAIDNIDNSLNPKLCIKLIQTLTDLSKESNKQVIVSTHNPAVLDGLNLADDEQRLFVVYRNIHGHTTIKRVNAPKKVKGVDTVRLSEAFLRGYLGGLPKNF